MGLPPPFPGVKPTAHVVRAPATGGRRQAMSAWKGHRDVGDTPLGSHELADGRSRQTL